MTWSEIVVYLFYAFLITTASGSVFFLLWLLLKQCLPKGNELLLVRCLRIGVQIYLIPVLFGFLLWKNGDNILLAPWADGGAPQIRVFMFPTRPIILTAEALMAAWCVGIATALIRHLRTRKEMREQLMLSEPESDQRVLACYEKIRERLGIHREIRVFRSSVIPVPCTAGHFRQKIILPAKTDTYSETELEVLFAHELMHCRRHDLFYKAEFVLMQIIHAVNPLAYVMKDIHGDYTEFACDAAVCMELEDLFSTKEYCGALFRMAAEDEQNGTGKDRDDTKLVEKTCSLQRRIEAMHKYNKAKKMKKQITALVVALFVLGSSMTAYAAGDGIVAIYGVFEDATLHVRLAAPQDPVDFNTLTEYTMSAEEFEALNAIEMEEGMHNETRSGSSFNWPLDANATCRTTAFWVNAGGKVGVTSYTRPDGQHVRVGIKKVEGDAVYVDGYGDINYTFTVSESAHYYFFVENLSGQHITVAGAYTNSAPSSSTGQ